MEGEIKHSKKERRKVSQREIKNSKAEKAGARKKSSTEKSRKEEKHVIEMKSIGVEVSPIIYQRFAKDRKVTFNTSTKDFIEHLETPSPGSLTGGQLPYTPETTMLGHRRALMNQVLACGPSKDPVHHRGLFPAKTTLPTAMPFLLDIVVLLAIPVAPQMSTKDREILLILQAIARHHHSGFTDEYENIVDEMTRLADILQTRNDSSLRTMILTSLMTKKNLTQRSQKVLFDTLSNEIEIDREQIISVIAALRSRDQLSREQGTKIKEELSLTIHDRRNCKIKAAELVRKIIKVKNG